TDVILNFTARLGGPGLSINQQNVATALNSFFNNGGALTPGFVSVFGLTGGNLANALTLLSGEAATRAQQAAFQLTNQFLGIMLDAFVDGRSGSAGTGGPALGFAPERDELPDDIALAYNKIRRRSRRRSTSAGACGAQATAEATARLVIPCLSAAMICPRAPRAAPPGSIIASRRARWWAWRSPAAAPIGPWRRGSAAAGRSFTGPPARAHSQVRKRMMARALAGRYAHRRHPWAARCGVDVRAASRVDRGGSLFVDDTGLRGAPGTLRGSGADLRDRSALGRVAHHGRSAFCADGDPDGAARPQRRARHRDQSAAGGSAAG